MPKNQPPTYSPAVPKPAAPAESSSPSRGSASSKKKLTATEYIRQHPNVPATELVAKGKGEGFHFSRNLVYLVRGPRSGGAPKKSGASKASKGGAPRRKPGRPAKAAAPVSAPSRRSHSTEEADLARAILSVGFDRAQDVIDRLRRALS